MAGRTLTLLGGFSLRDEHAREVRIRSRKGRALLVALAAAPAAALSRERLVGLLWADVPDERARQSLRQTASELRRAAPGLLVSHGAALALDLAACEVDVREFRALASAPDPQALATAVALYRGHFADGVDVAEEAFEQWARVEAAQLAALASDALSRLVASLRASGDPRSAVDVLQRWVALDPLSEEASHGLVESLRALGRDEAAARCLHSYCEAVRSELGVEPPQRMLALADEIRDRRAPPPVPAGGTAGLGPSHPVVAVLPFSAPAGADDLASIAQDVAVDLTASLARAPGIRVIAWQASAAASASSSNPQDVGDALGARYLVTGGVRRLGGDTLRFNVELIAGGLHLWGRHEEFPGRRTTEVPGDVASILAARLEPQIILAALQHAASMPLASEDAWAMLRRAMGALFARGWSEAAVDAAVRSFRGSIDADPDLALAHACKALVLSIGGKMRLVSGEALHAEAQRDAERAISLDPRNSEVLGYAGCAIADLGDPVRARPLLERAVEENPGNPQAWAALGACQLMLARVRPGVESLRRGLYVGAGDYRRPVWLTLLAGALMRLKEQEESVQTAREACSSDANFYPARVVLAAALLRAGREGEARKALAEARRIRPTMQLDELQTWVGRRGQRELGAIWSH